MNGATLALPVLLGVLVIIAAAFVRSRDDDVWLDDLARRSAERDALRRATGGR